MTLNRGGMQLKGLVIQTMIGNVSQTPGPFDQPQ